MEQLKLRDTRPALCGDRCGKMHSKREISGARCKVIRSRDGHFPDDGALALFPQNKKWPNALLRPKIDMKKNTPPALSGNDTPEPHATDRKRL